MLVEESSSSILEMGAAGEELSDTAGVLSSRIEEVSSSIEQMVRSVKEVNSHASSLSEAASDTASNMEEMASAMRQVDTIADEASGLSDRVVEAADGGREAVRQTISGMESIRDATAQAEHVIAGLGARTSEIGSILDVIDDVADETNLLALNAAIIACGIAAPRRGIKKPGFLEKPGFSHTITAVAAAPVPVVRRYACPIRAQLGRSQQRTEFRADTGTARCRSPCR